MLQTRNISGIQNLNIKIIKIEYDINEYEKYFNVFLSKKLGLLYEWSTE